MMLILLMENWLDNPELNPFFVNELELTPEQIQASNELEQYFSSLIGEDTPGAGYTEGNLISTSETGSAVSAIEADGEQPAVGFGIDNGGIIGSSEGVA